MGNYPVLEKSCPLAALDYALLGAEGTNRAWQGAALESKPRSVI